MALDRELQNLLKQLKSVGVETKEFEKQLADAEKAGKSNVAVIKEMQNALKGARDILDDTEGSASNLYSQLVQVTSEISNNNKAFNDGKTAVEKLTNIARELKDEEVGLTELSIDRITKLNEEALLKKEAAEQAADIVKTNSEVSSLLKTIDELIAEGSLKEEERLDFLQEQLKTVDSLSDRQKALVLATEDDLGLLQQVVDATSRRLALEQNIQKALGISGSLIGGLGKIAGTLGLSGDAFTTSLKSANAAMRDKAKKELEKSADGTVNAFSRLKIIAAGSGEVIKGIRDTLFSTEAIFGAILKTAMSFNKASVESRRLTGQTLEITQGLESSFSSTVDQLKLANEITKELGFNAMNIMSPSTLAGAADLQVLLGLSAHEAKNFAIFAEKGGYEVDNLAEGVVKQVNSFNKANKSAVSQGQILKDVGNVSKAISASLGSNPKAIAEAAAAARRLGLDLKTVDGIADSLLDFESSIGNEIEAQLLTGKQINMSKARELALNNDLAGLGKELFNNAVDIAEFGKMNRIQQEAQAKALGMTRDQLAKVAYLRALEKGMTEDQAAAAANVNLSDMQRMTAAENFQKAIERITGALSPLINTVADFLSMRFAPYIVFGTVALTKMFGAVKAITAGIAAFRTFTAASTVATNVDTASKIANSTATTTLAGSTTALATTSATASTTIGASMRAIAMGFAAFASPPVALGVAVVTGAVLGLGAALYMAKDAVVGIAKAIGNTIVGIFQSLPPIITAVSDGFNNILETITLEKAAAVGLLGLSFISLAGGLTILSASIFTSLPGIAILGSIAMMGSGLMNAGSGMERLVAGVKDLKSALNQLEIEKLKELEDFTAKTAIAAPITTVEGAITSLGDGIGNVLSNITGGTSVVDGISNVVAGITGGRGGNNAALEAKLDELIAITAEGKTIVMDGSVVGNTITRVSPKSS